MFLFLSTTYQIIQKVWQEETIPFSLNNKHVSL